MLACLFLLATMPVRAQRPIGTDVSGFQPSINWTTVKNAGVTFAWAKASQGTRYTYASTFPAQEAGAKGVGIYIGAYHYAMPSVNTNVTGANSADSEAAYFWGQCSNYVKNGGAYLVPMLDWEDVGVTNSSVAPFLTKTVLTAWANEWCLSVSNLAAASGVIVRPVIYTGTWYSVAGTYPGLSTAITNWPNWIASYPANALAQTGSPSSVSPWPTSSWNLWQYGDTNWSGGDSDVYNGTLASFVQKFVVGGTNAPSFASPASVSVAQGAGATFSISPTGLAPLTMQWQFNGANIPAATSSNYTIASAQLTDAGDYRIIVANSYASVTSSVAILSVTAPLTNATGSVLAPAGLVDWWPAEANGSDIFGSLNASPSNTLSYVTGKTGLAFHFNGTDSDLLVPGGTAIAPNWTACMWVNRQAAPGTAASLLGDTTYALKLEQYNGTHEVGFTKSGVADFVFSPAYSAPVGVWTHLGFVGTSSGITLYTNGVQEGTITTNGLSLPRACIGADLLASGNPVDFMAGSLDEIQLFNTALTGPQIQAIYAAGAAGLVRVPQLVSITNSAAGQVQLSLIGQTGKTFTLHTSTNLVNWTSLGAMSNPSGSIQYSDSTLSPQKFYRLSQP